jgi:hypothetical protein
VWGMKNQRLRIAFRIVLLILLSFARDGGAAEVQDSSQRKAAETFAGNWTAVGELQGYFDRLSSAPSQLGRAVDLLQIEFMKPEELWGEGIDFRRGEPRIKKLLADANHEIVAAGMLATTDKSRDGDMAFFLLTQCDGETFLCALAVDGDVSFEPWRIHRIPGKERSDDVLIVEFGKASRKQICAFKRAASTASE